MTGKELKIFCLKQGFRNKDLVQATGKTPTTISRWFAFEKVPDEIVALVEKVIQDKAPSRTQQVYLRPPKNSLHSQLAFLMDREGLTPEHLHETGIKKELLNRFISGEKCPDIEQTKLIGTYLRCNKNEMIMLLEAATWENLDREAQEMILDLKEYVKNYRG